MENHRTRLSTSQSRLVETSAYRSVSKTKQADNEIHEDQLLNFLVKRVDEEVSLGLGDNAEINAEDIYEVPSIQAPEDLGLYPSNAAVK